MKKLKNLLYKLPFLSFMTISVLVSSVKPSHASSAVDVLIQMGLAKANALLVNTLNSKLNLGACKGNGQISDVICNVMGASAGLPGLITALSYLFGVILAVAALFKLKDHVLNPSQTPLSDSLKRFLAGGALFTLPLITEAAQNALTGGSMASSKVTVYSGQAASASGLDGMLVSLFADIYEPMISIIFAFGYLAGLILVVLGIGRIIKTAQDGPRGPAGMGTIMMFVIAGVLFSLSSIMGAFSSSMFQSSTVATFAVLETSTGDTVIDNHVLAMISTVLVFMTIIGYISFMRGFFIIKDVAEGGGQASLMAGVTHIFGGALAVNLGPLLNAVQSTLGLSDIGITFY
jgi:hypothetical protein